MDARSFGLGVMACCMMFGQVSAVVVDGTVSPGEYGAPLAVQDTPTGFGDTDGGSSGSELNALFAKLQPNGDLALAMTGNLEENGNGIVLLLDVRAGGAVDSGTGRVGSIGGRYTDDLGTDVDGGPGMTTPPLLGSILPAGFNPDIALEINAGGTLGEYYISIIDLTYENDTSSFPDIDRFLGFNFLDSGSVTQNYDRVDTDIAKGHGGAITHAFDNSNIAGVTGSDASDPLSATTGIELLLSADFLKHDPGQAIKLLPFLTNGGGDFLSNQFLPGLDGADNLGGRTSPDDPLFDASSFPTVTPVSIPEPSTLMLATGLVALVWPACRPRSWGA